MTAIRSFPSGSSGGIDGFTPQHLKDLVGEAGLEGPLVVALTGFVNTLLRGDSPEAIIPILFGGRLIALAKKEGGIRPIAVGSVWRRLASKCASTYAIRATRDLLAPRQVGVGVPGGAEASVHASRRFIDSLKTNQFFFKLDFSNALNTPRRDSMLEAVKAEVPEIYNFCHLSYAHGSDLIFAERVIRSEEGPQQGDPLWPVSILPGTETIAQHPQFRSGAGLSRRCIGGW